MSRKLSQRARERRINRILVIGTIAIIVLALLILAWGLYDQYVLRPKTPVATGKVPEELVTEFMASIYGVEPIYLNEVDIPPEMAQKLPEDMARRFIIIPVEDTSHGFHVAMANPGNLYAIDELKFSIGKEVIPFASAPSAIRRGLDELYGKVDDLVTVEEQLDDYDEEEDELEEVDSLEIADGEDEDPDEDEYTTVDENEPVVL